MNTDSLHSLVEIAKNVAVLAGKKVLDIYDKEDFESFEKDDESPVTTADYEANDIIMSALLEATPDIPIMSEETEQLPLQERSKWTRYWLIDPIDGTQEFIARSGDFAVNIALIENNVPVVGAIYWPAGQTLYFASLHNGAFKTCPLETKQIHVRQFEKPSTDVIMIAISRRQSRDGVFSRMTDTRNYQTLPAGSCSLKACLIAEGKADVFMRLGVTGEWDTGASQCIISEAGGEIRDVYFEPLSYNKRDSVENPDFVVLGDARVDWQNIVQYRPR